MNDPELFNRIGEAMYGGNWKRALADEMGVRQSSVQNWARGSNRIYPDIWESIAAVIARRQMELASLLELARGKANGVEGL